MPDLVETVAISDIFVSGCAKIEEAGGGCLRFYLYAQQGDEKVLVCKIVCPVAYTHAINEMKRRFFEKGGGVLREHECEIVTH